MTPRRITGLLMISICLWASDARGQARSDLGRALDKVHKNESVRVRAESGLFEGEMDAITLDTLHLRTATGVIAVSPRSVRNIWVKRNIRPEAIGIGAMMGAILGAGLGTIARNNTCDALTGCKGNIPLKLIAGTVAGGVAGGLIGAALGGTRRHWAQIFPD